MKRPVLLAGLGASLAINAYRTLKFLDFSITVEDDYDPLCSLSHELRFIMGNNTLEEFKLYVSIKDEMPFETESVDWSAALDSVLTESGAFLMLHRVSVEIHWFSEYMDLDGMKFVMENLKKGKFPRLVESKALEFNFNSRVVSLLTLL